MAGIKVSSEFMVFDDSTGTWEIRPAYLDSILAFRANEQKYEGCDPCTPSKRHCNICWSIGPAGQILTAGQEITIAFTGAPRGTVAKFWLVTPSQDRVPVFVVADELGNGQLAISILNGPGTYYVEPADNSCPCSFSPLRADFSVSDPCAPACPTTEFSTGPADACNTTVSGIFSHGLVGYDECSGAVTITPKFVQPTVPSGTSIVLEIRVKNNNASPVKFSLAPLSLPTGLSGTVSIVETVIQGKTEIVRTFTLSANPVAEDTPVVLAIPYGAGTYQCGGVQFSASAAQDLVTVLPTGSGCDVRIESFYFTPAVAANGGSTNLVLIIKNYGTMSSAFASIPVPQFPAGFTPSTTLGSILTSMLLAPGQSSTFTIPGVVAHTAGTVQNMIATIPVGALSWTCGTGTEVSSNPAVVSATVAVNPAAGTAGGACNGTVTWERKELTSCGLNILLSGAAANTEYTASVSGTVAGTYTFTTDENGDGSLPVYYDSGVANSQIQVVVSLPGICQYPPLTIQLPECEAEILF